MADITLKLRIDGSAAGVVKATTEAERAVSGFSAAAQGASNGATRGFSASGRAAVNLSGAIDRMRSSAVQLAAVLGVAGGLSQFARGVLDSSNALTGFRQGLVAATGSQQAAAQSLAFVRAESQRLGTDLRSSAEAFTGLSAAAKGTALEGAQTREIFSAVSEASRVLNLSSDQARGALLALQQMMSKGTVQAEELRGQLGERLPGAFNLAARAMGVSTAELGDMLERGDVLATDLLPKLAVELRKTFGAQAASAANAPAAEMQRLRNAVFELQAAIGDAGFMQALARGARALADDLSGLARSGAMDTIVAGLGLVAKAALIAFGGRIIGAIGEYLGKLRLAAAAQSGMIEMQRAVASAALDTARARAVELTETLRVIEAVRAETLAKQRLAATEAERRALNTQLATLGRQTASVQVQLANAANAQIAAQSTLNATLARGGVVMAGARAAGTRLLSFIGGWPTLLLGAGFAIKTLWDRVAEGKVAARAPITALAELNQKLTEQVKLAELVASGKATPENAAVVSVLETARANAASLAQQLEQARQRLFELASSGAERGFASQAALVNTLESRLKDANEALAENIELNKRLLIAGTQFIDPGELVAKDRQAQADRLRDFIKSANDSAAALKAERIELTQGTRARIEHQALVAAGVGSVDKLNKATRDAIDALVGETIANQAAKDAQKRANEHREQAKAATDKAREAGEQFRAETERLRAELAGPQQQALSGYAAQIANANELLAQGAISVQDFADRQAVALEQLDRTTASLVEQQSPIQQMLDDLQFEAELIGKSNVEREVAIALRQAEQALQQSGIDLSSAEAQAQLDAIANTVRANAAQQEAVDIARQAAEDYQRAWQGATDSVARAFGDLVTGGLDSFKDGLIYLASRTAITALR